VSPNARSRTALKSIAFAGVTSWRKIIQTTETGFACGEIFMQELAAPPAFEKSLAVRCHF
jgi:hypothetical protein